MASIPLILLLLAFIFEALATAGIPSPPRFQFMPAGWACFLLSLIIGGMHL